MSYGKLYIMRAPLKSMRLFQIVRINTRLHSVLLLLLSLAENDIDQSHSRMSMLRLLVLVALCVGKSDCESEIVPRVEADIHHVTVSNADRLSDCHANFGDIISVTIHCSDDAETTHTGFPQMTSTVPVAIVTTLPAIRANRPFRRPGQSEIQQRQEHQLRQHRAGLNYYGVGCMSDSIYLSQGQSAGPHETWATRDREQEPVGVVLATNSRHSGPCTELAESMVQRIETRDLAEANTSEKPCISVRATDSISDARTSVHAQIAAETCASTLGRNLSALSLALPDFIEFKIADARLSGSLDITEDQRPTSACSVDCLPSVSPYHCRNGLQPEESTSDTHTRDENLSRIESHDDGRATRLSCFTTLNKTESSTIVKAQTIVRGFASLPAVTSAPFDGPNDEGKTLVSTFATSSGCGMAISPSFSLTFTTDHASNYSRSAARPTTSPSLYSSGAPRKCVMSWVLVILYSSILFILQLMTDITFYLS